MTEICPICKKPIKGLNCGGDCEKCVRAAEKNFKAYLSSPTDPRD